MGRIATVFLLLVGVASGATPAPFQISGIYPHLATFNLERECGTGAVVPWADRLWVVSYAPHSPRGSTDKLYEITPDLQQIIRPESIGGTPANRFIHRESQQLFIGPYVIDAQRNVRVISYETMFGRPTGNARHLIDPSNKVYCASMEEGLYEIDVHSLAVTELFRDEQLKDGRKANLPGYHGKGLFSGQGVLVYANNGENTPLARQKPDIPSGALAEWDGRSDTWTVVRRNQFTEVSGPGGLSGNDNAATDPIWTIGWDHRSLILMVRDAGKWHSYRLPKASHSYDGAHGWNTEWPRIRDIGERDLLMTMHGTFWRFPRTFTSTNSGGIMPRSNYLKVVGDFTRWGDQIVLGCDDTALSEFLNKRRAKGNLAAPGQSQSNLWFVAPEQLDQFGPAIGRGAVWQDEPVKKDEASDAFLFSGYEQRVLLLAHDAKADVTFTLEVDRMGNDQWSRLRTVKVPAAGYATVAFTAEERGAWIRLRAARDLAKATAVFALSNRDWREMRPSDDRFVGIATDPRSRTASGGLLHARGGEKKTLGVAAKLTSPGPNINPADPRAADKTAFYEMGPDMVLRRSEEAGALDWMQQNVATLKDAVTMDEASIIYTDESGQRFRLPKGRTDYMMEGPFGPERTVREVCTERDLLNCGGTFFELPAENAGGIAKVRPIATHNRRIHDFATWRGLLVMTGVESASLGAARHIIRSEDRRAAVWVGAVDDLWSFGRPVGQGGPWKNTIVKPGEKSDPYLMTGYEKKMLTLVQNGVKSSRIRVEVDLTGAGNWVEYAVFDVATGKPKTHIFPVGFQAYWVRVSSDQATLATAWFVYE